MTFDASDPRLTAYALGELDGTERAEIEALLAESPEARRFVEEVRETARILTEQFRLEPSPGLAPAQREAIEVGLQTGCAPPRRWPRWVASAAAASVLGMMATFVLLDR